MRPNGLRGKKRLSASMLVAIGFVPLLFLTFFVAACAERGTSEGAAGGGSEGPSGAAGGDGAGGIPAEEAADLAEIEARYEAARVLAADLSCSAHSSCDAIGLGSKPCGGPQEQLVYSRDRVEEVELEAVAEATIEAEERYRQEWCDADDNPRYDTCYSNCDYLVEPPVACIDGKCTVVDESFDTSSGGTEDPQ